MTSTETAEARARIERFYANPTGEYEHALKLANRVLDEPNRDPDSDLSLLARQFLRRVENIQMLLTPPAQGGEWRWVPVEPTEEMVNEGFHECVADTGPEAVWSAMLSAIPDASPGRDRSSAYSASDAGEG